MSDGGWLIGLLAWAGIFGGAAAYAFAVLRLHSRPPSPTTQPQQGGRSDIRAILDAQAKAAERSAAKTRINGITLDDWLEAFAKRLAELWGIDREEARRLGREWLKMCDMRFPDPSYDWSLRGAVEMAEEYARENGEEYGANS